MIKVWFTISLILFLSGCTENVKTDYLNIAENLQFVGIAVEEPGYHVWGSSPIIGPEGKTHLFVARWPKEFGVDPGWRSHSEIAHYISEKPEGPFKFSEIVVKGSGKDTWDKFGAHNPCIKKVGNSYFLFYIANDNPNQPPHPKNQRIGMLVSKTLNGPWAKTGEDGLILQPSNDPKNWSFESGNGVVNPAFLAMPDNKFFLYFKSWVQNQMDGGRAAVMGLAIADKPEGPYKITEQPITANQKTIEDGYAFEFNGKYYLLTTDNHGIFLRGGGILWESSDGQLFGSPRIGYDLIKKYYEYDKNKIRRFYGPGDVKFERPQILLISGKPAYMYAPSGHNIFDGDATVSYVLKISL